MKDEKVIIDRGRLEQLETFERNNEKIMIEKSNVESWTKQIDRVQYIGRDEVILILEEKINKANVNIIKLNNIIKGIEYGND
jgi:hexokinase